MAETGAKKNAMSKARQPDIVFIPRGVTPESVRESLVGEGRKLVTEPKPGPNVVYYDGRTMPRQCERTGMQRDFCCCAPCRARRRRKHGASCRCWLCYADRQGEFIDSLGSRTAAGKFALFLTLTYRTKGIVKRLNAGVSNARDEQIQSLGQPQPNPDFVRNFFARMIRWLETEIGGPVEYFLADQYGETGGRLHQHAGIASPALLLAAEELAAMLRVDPKTKRLPGVLKPFAKMLVEKAGFNRVLPWEMDAGYYIGRYIGRDAERCHWDFRVGPEPVKRVPVIGRQVVAVSVAPDDSSRAYRNVLKGWHR
jgi:hypothetical protein